MTEDRARLDAARAARWGLFVLTVINLFNYLDRWVGAALVESLRHSELHLTDAQSGSLASGFVIVYMLASPLFGTLGDRAARPRLLALGVGIWSVATALGALAHNYGMLFVARSTVGIGEAAYVTIASALLADYYPIEQRGRVFAVFNAAIPIGSAAGYVLGGLVEQHYGWRAAFLVAGLPGIALAVLAGRLWDPPRGIQDRPPATAPDRSALDPAETPATAPDQAIAPAIAPDQAIASAIAPDRSRAGFATALRDYAALLRNRPYRLTALGYAAYTFALGGLAYWTPAFLERVRGMSRADATVQFGVIVVATGFAGTFAGGWLGDYFLRRNRQAYLWLSGVTALAAAPLALVAFGAASRPLYMTAMVAAEVLAFMSTGPVNSAVVNLVEPRRRATAVGLSTLIVHLFGDVPSPPLIGAISDRSSLGRAFLLVPLALVVAGCVLMWAARVGERSSGPAILAADGAQE